MLLPSLLRSFYVSIVMRITGIAIAALLLGFAVSYPMQLVYIIGLLILFVFQVVGLIKYVNRTNLDVARIINSVLHGDFTAGTYTRRGGSYTALENALQEIMQTFKDVRKEKEEQARFLHTIIQNIGIGVLVYTQSGKIVTQNNSARKILQVSDLQNITILQQRNPDLYRQLTTLPEGERRIIKTTFQNEIQHWYVYSTVLKLQTDVLTLLMLQNVQNEIEEQEMDAWQKLIRVLTHEIMNSITPISSLAATMQGMLPATPADANISAETLTDMTLAVQSIRKRSEGLISFVENYRSLVKIPKPDFSVLPIKQLFHQVGKLLESDSAKAGISITFEVQPKTLELTADAVLIEQVLINLITNALHATKGISQPVITVKAVLNELGRVVITVSDNGAGIAPEAIERIFIPFFTTKTEGSGIGLSLSRQIMRAHGGTIRASSVPGDKTIFTLRF